MGGQQSVCWDSSTWDTLWVPHNINRHPSTSVVCQRSIEDMSDEEYYEEEEEEEVEEEEEEEEEEEDEEADAKQAALEKKSVRSEISQGEGTENVLKARLEAKKGELDEQLMEYIDEWRKQRSKEEEELKRLKEKQAKRKEVRAEQ